MKLKPILLPALVLSILAGCSNDNLKTENKAVKKEVEKPVEDFKPEPAVSENLNDFVVNNELTSNWVSSLSNIDPAGFTGDKTPVTNRHNPAITDTIVTLRSGETMVEFYHTASNAMLQSAKINNGTIRLGNTVKIGMRRNELEKLLNQKIPGNQIQVGDEEKFSIFRFELANDTLKSIRFEGYVD